MRLANMGKKHVRDPKVHNPGFGARRRKEFQSTREAAFAVKVKHPTLAKDMYGPWGWVTGGTPLLGILDPGMTSHWFSRRLLPKSVAAKIVEAFKAKGCKVKLVTVWRKNK